MVLEENDFFEYARVLREDRSLIELGFSCDASEMGLVPGRIVWGMEDGGFLRRIVSAEFDGTTAVLTTEFASLAEAVTDVEFDVTWDFSGERRVVDFSGRVLDETAVEGGMASVTVTRGSLNMQPQIDARGRFGFLRLKSVTSRNRVFLSLDMDVAYHTDGPVERAQTVEIERYSHPFTLRVGPVRIRGQLNSVVSLGFVHSSTGPMDVDTSFSGSGTIEMGGVYTMPNSWNPIWNPEFSGTVTELVPRGSGEWNGRVFAHVSGTVVLNGNEGGTSEYELYSEASAQGDCDGVSWETWGGIDAETVMKLRFMGRSVDHTFPHLDIEADRRDGVVDNAAPPPECGGTGGGVCAPVASVTCGQVIQGDTATDPAATSELDAYPCNVGNYQAPELVYQWQATTGGPVTLELLDPEPTELNHDLIVLDGSGGCSADACVAQGFNSVQFDAVPGHTYYLVVDGYDLHAGPFAAQLTCGLVF
jgi:hypothetical protein